MVRRRAGILVATVALLTVTASCYGALRSGPAREDMREGKRGADRMATAAGTRVHTESVKFLQFTAAPFRGTCWGVKLPRDRQQPLEETVLQQDAAGSFVALWYTVNPDGVRTLRCSYHGDLDRWVSYCPEAGRQLVIEGDSTEPPLLQVEQPVDFANRLIGFYPPVSFAARDIEMAVWADAIENAGIERVDGVMALRLAVPAVGGSADVWLDRRTGRKVRVMRYDDGKPAGLWWCRPDASVEDGWGASRLVDPTGAVETERVYAIGCTFNSEECAEQRRSIGVRDEWPANWAIASETHIMRQRTNGQATPRAATAVAVIRHVGAPDGSQLVVVQRPVIRPSYLPRLDDWIEWTRCRAADAAPARPVLYVAGSIGDSYLRWVDSQRDVETVALAGHDAIESLHDMAERLPLGVVTCPSGP